MSKRTRRRREAPMPATGAGLLRFYSESDSPGIKIGPIPVMVAAGGLIFLVLLLHVLKL
ncbi:MAG: preprotein translocase subunit Sec61beta [Candidatus Hodarchaeota archaeon]